MCIAQKLYKNPLLFIGNEMSADARAIAKSLEDDDEFVIDDECEVKYMITADDSRCGPVHVEPTLPTTLHPSPSHSHSHSPRAPHRLQS